MDKQRIVIFLEGGLVQRIEAEQGTEVMILDFDTQGGDDERIQPIRDIDGTVEDVFVSRWWIEAHPETVEYFLNQIKEEV